MKVLTATIFFISLVLFSAVSTANKPENHFTDTPISTLPSGSGVLLLPLNPNRQLKENEISTLQSEIYLQLKKAGAAVKNAKIENPQDRFDYLLMTSEQASNMPDTQQAKENFAQIVAGNNKLVIIPSVVEKAANVSGQKMYLDGNKLTIRYEGRGGDGNWSGQQRGLTLELEVYNQDGSWLMSVYGGVAMPRYADMYEKGFYRKDDVFEHKRDKKSMKKGVQIALKPVVKTFKFK